jgi:N-acetylmuramoyl-L-alanine amidase
MHVNESHQLVSDEGEDFNVVEITPHEWNYDSNLKHINEPELIIMHYTTGTKMESTINAFTNAPKDRSSGASAHLLVGRDGSVVQFLRFDRIAYHAGFSWWEGKRSLNNCSIGIELDNVGQLIIKDGKWQPPRQDKITIPDEEVQRSEYWKAPLPAGNRDDPEYAGKLPGWQKFTDVQLAVVANIVQALAGKYTGIREILGHDQINLAERYDPGPLLPMAELRQALFGRQEPKIDEYTINQAKGLYANVEGTLPNTQSIVVGELPANSQVSLEKQESGFAMVNVINPKAPKVKGRGWVQSNSLASPQKSAKTKGGNKNVNVEDKARITTRSQPFFKQSEKAPTLKVNGGLVFQARARVRIQEFRDEWALVALLDRINGRGETDNEHGMGGLEGWMLKEFLTLKDGKP